MPLHKPAERLVSGVMSRAPLAVNARTPVHAALRLAIQREVHDVVVLASREPVGVICVCDLERVHPSARIAGCLARPVVRIEPHRTIFEAVSRMETSGVGSLVVTDEEGSLLGIVTRHDLRSIGALGRELGIDLCASCGSGHHLSAPPGTPKFCAACLGLAKGSGRGARWYTTLGGSG